MVGRGEQLSDIGCHILPIAWGSPLRYCLIVMANFHPPQPKRPLVLVGAEGEDSILQIDPDAVIANYKAHGAMLFRGFDTDLAQFNAFAKQFCSTSVVNESPGRALLDPGNAIYSVDGGTNAFSLHPELSREPWKPDLAMFGCLSPPGQGGHTTLCDGIALVKALPPEVREVLTGRRLVYVKGSWPELLEFWLGSAEPSDDVLRNPPAGCPYSLMRMRDGRIARQFSRPALHKPMFADELAFGNFLLFARFNNGRLGFPLLDDYTAVPDEWLHAIKATGDAHTLAVQWQKGDVLLLDNTRFMHGRTAILDAAERQIATYFGYLNFAVPDPEEPADAIWRRQDFEPPRPPEELVRRL
jgi:alpha-ketoglutarate-dependent taurine dioxygenase